METIRTCPHPRDYRFAEERLRFVLRASGLDHCSFAREIGLADSEEVYRILYREAPLTVQLVRRIHARFPQIDPGWLLTGCVGEADQ